MNKILSLAALAALIASPAFAQETVLGDAAGQASQTALDAGKNLNSNAARAGRVIGAISCVGSADVSAVIDSARDKARIEFASQAEPAKLVQSASGAVIRLSDKLPDYPRVWIAYVVDQAFPLAYPDMPESVEAEYMRLSLAARGWLELGGQASKLPVLEPLTGYRDASLGGAFSLWIGAPGDARQALAKSGKIKSLEQLISQETDKAKLAKLDRAVKEYAAFMQSESDWMLANASRLQE